MFAVISSPQFWQEIEEVIKTTGEEILFQKIDREIDIIAEIEKISRISVRHLIIDITALEDEERLAQAVRRYRIRYDKPQIIIIAPNYEPGNETLSLLVTMKVYDILAPKGENLDNIKITQMLQEVLQNPTTYGKAVRWDKLEAIYDGKTEAAATKEAKSSKGLDILKNIKGRENKTQQEAQQIIQQQQEQLIINKLETIYKDRIIGSIVIGIASAQPGAGSTHTTISLANYLSSMEYETAVIDLTENKALNSLKHIDKMQRTSYFQYEGVDYYIDDKDFTDIFQKKYKYVILDMGLLKTKDHTHRFMNEMNRADISILVTGIKEWQLDDLAICLKGIPEKWFLYVNHADKETYDSYKKHSKHENTVLGPFCPDPFKQYKEQERIFNEILTEVLPQASQKKKKKIGESLRNVFMPWA